MTRLDRVERELRELQTQRLEPARRARFHAAIATLRQWSLDAQGTTVTQGNAVTVLQVVVNRLGVFFDDFADLLEDQISRR